MEAVAADVWDRTVRLLKDPAGLGAGLTALRETKSFLENMVAGALARIEAVHEERALALEPWTDLADTSEQAEDLRRDQASHLKALDSEEELADDRLEYAEFQIRIVNTVLWNLVGHGVTASWDELSAAARADVLGVEQAERPLGIVAKHAALLVWVIDNPTKAQRAITGPVKWESAVDTKLDALFSVKKGGGGPAGESLWTMVSKEARERFPNEWSSGRGEADFARKVDVVRRLAALYDGPVDATGCPVY